MSGFPREYAQDPREYERELKRQLEDMFTRVQQIRLIHSPRISFEGEHPDTVLTIEWQRPSGRLERLSLTIWKEEDEYLTSAEPTSAATDIFVLVMES